jgi:hypothetical protein
LGIKGGEEGVGEWFESGVRGGREDSEADTFWHFWCEVLAKKERKEKVGKDEMCSFHTYLSNKAASIGVPILTNLTDPALRIHGKAFIARR